VALIVIVTAAGGAVVRVADAAGAGVVACRCVAALEPQALRPAASAADRAVAASAREAVAAGERGALAANTLRFGAGWVRDTAQRYPEA
jgi:hypothetical protein